VLCFSGLLAFLRDLANGHNDPIHQITPEDILAYKMSSTQASYRLAHIRSFMKRWAALGAPGIGKDVTELLDQLTLKQNPVGVAVATLDPKKGPFSDLEFEAILAALNDAYAQGEIATDAFLLSFLLIALGSRPVQLASLKCCDLIVPKKGQGSDYILMVPRAKQKNQAWREEFKARPLTYQLGEALHRHIQGVYTRFAGKIADPGLAPMFPQTYFSKFADTPGFEYHQTSAGVAAKIINIFKKLRIPSERLGGRDILASPLRFRRTFATRAAEEGLPLLVIAELMDHANTRHVAIYVGLTTRIRANFSRKIAMQMAPLAQVFSGRIIEKEVDATRPDSTSRIVDLRVDQHGAGMGSCGTHAHCGFAKPIACYACNSFEPWLDGPHEAMLDYMLERREHQLKKTDPRIASINDRSILGCAQVVIRCRELKTRSTHG
jgi:integrase